MLEYSCKTDYKMITRKLENVHVKLLNEKEKALKEVIADNMAKESLVHDKMKQMHKVINDADKERVRISNEKDQLVSEI